MNHYQQAKLEIKGANGIKVKVKLINSIDESLVARGLLKPEEIHFDETEAIVDRSNVHSALPMDLVKKLGLDIWRKQVIQFADGREKVVQFTDPVKFQVGDREATVETMIAGDEVVIGRVALELLDLVVDRDQERLIPNPAHPNGPVFRI